jgi:hypothetical protein
MAVATVFAMLVLGRVLRETAALVALIAFALQLALLAVAAMDFLPGESCPGGVGDGVLLALMVASAVGGGVAFGATFAATNRHPVSAAVAFVGAALPYVTFFIGYAPGC